MHHSEYIVDLFRRLSNSWLTASVKKALAMLWLSAAKAPFLYASLGARCHLRSFDALVRQDLTDFALEDITFTRQNV